MRRSNTPDPLWGLFHCFWFGRIDGSCVPRAVRLPLVVLFCLFFLGVQVLIAAVIWFFGLVLPLQPWSSLFFDCLVVVIGGGGMVVLLQPLLRHRLAWKHWQIKDRRLQGVLLLLLPSVEIGTIAGELLALHLPNYLWGDILPLFWLFLFLVLMQVLLAGVGGKLAYAGASS